MTPTIPAGTRVLLIDDDDVFRPRLARALSERGLTVEHAENAEAGRAILRRFAADYILLDLKMPGETGLEALPSLTALVPDVRVVILTGYGSISTAVDAIRLGAVHYVQKPADADDVMAGMWRASQAPLAGESPAYEAPSLARAEWEHINRVLDDCGGNVSEAARRLGMHRRSLQRKLQKYPPKV